MKQHKRMDTRQRILDLLERRKWPVWRLAQKSGINHSTIFNMIQRKNMPSLKTIEEVTAAFGISMRQFFAEKRRPGTVYATAGSSILSLSRHQHTAAKSYPACDGAIV